MWQQFDALQAQRPFHMSKDANSPRIDITPMMDRRFRFAGYAHNLPEMATRRKSTS
jgi:hypothetical protein